MSNLADQLAHRVNPLEQHVYTRKATRGQPPLLITAIFPTLHTYFQLAFNRGIPSGYISSLEERLIETEIALFEALSFINIHFHQDSYIQSESSQHRDAFTEHSMALSKQAKVEEWKFIPLTFEDQRKTWFREKLRVINGREYRNDSIGESPVSHQTENQWLGPPLPLLANHNYTQLVPRGQPFIHNQNARDNQDIALSRYQLAMHVDESLEARHNYSSATIETPERPGMNTWANKSAQQRMTEEPQVLTGEVDSRAHDSYGAVANPQCLDDRQRSPEPHTGIERVPMGVEVSSSPQGQRNSISSGFARHSLEARRVSSKQWQRYF
ncbi:hypothetical protein V500_10768 [Pseudogymnoascus sp. VKM F-4518 (FW-2643)]|nr:hypothetical protein V500_10768 [Pseudogymnoascus sp. VKM F-4518 (FW-2643)]